MKKATFFSCAIIGIALTSCETIDTDALTSSTTTSTTETANTRSVQFVMKGLDVDYSTRATLATESITDLWVIEGDSCLCHQTSTDTDFGSPTVSLTIGAHDLTFIASKSDGQTFSKQWQCTKVKDTYGCVLAYTVSSSSTSKQVQLTRLNGKLKWTIEDAIPTGVSSVTISVPQCYALTDSLNGKSLSTCSYTFDITSLQGNSGVTLSTMVFPSSHTEGSTISPTITFSNGVTYTTECQIKPNIVTNIHGSFFDGSSKAQVTLSTEWSDTLSYAVR